MNFPYNVKGTGDLRSQSPKITKNLKNSIKLIPAAFSGRMKNYVQSRLSSKGYQLSDP